VQVIRFTPNAPAGPATYSWNADFPSIIPSSLGEKVCTIVFPIQNPSAYGVISWGTPYQYHGYTGFQGVVNNNSGSDNQILPIQLASFTAVRLGNEKVSLTWTTVSELNNYGFEVERSPDGKAFATIPGSFVAGNGTTNQSHSYSYVDAAPAGTASYRLMQRDLDGTVCYTEPVQLSTTTDVVDQMPADFSLEQNYPNPFNPSTTIRYSLPQRSQVTLSVFNTLGQEVARLADGARESGYHVVNLDARNLASGTYFYRLHAGTFVGTRRFTLLR
jgi:hypothetical protein